MNTVKKYFDFIALPLAILLWHSCKFITRWIDPTAGVDDLGLIQRPLFAFVTFLLFFAFVKLFMLLCWDTVSDYFRDQWATDFNNLTTWQKLLISSLLFCSFLLVLALLF